MCGIIGYTGSNNSINILMSGLSALEYRGYDSAGIAYFDENNSIQTIKSSGRLSSLSEKISDRQISSLCGIGHTRWATHGKPSDINAHPHSSSTVSLVHNGIIENYAKIKSFLKSHGYDFLSETDTEAAALLLDYNYKILKYPIKAIAGTSAMLEGSYAFAILFSDIPDTIYALRHDSPLILGVGAGENFAASDITAKKKKTKNYIALEHGEIGCIKSDKIEVVDFSANIIKKPVLTASWNFEQAQREGYEHFMLKEINEEPQSIINTLHPRIKEELPDFSCDSIDFDRIINSERIHIIACGTAMHAGLIGRMLIEKYAKIPVNVEIASEFRYNNPILSKNDTAIIISQSGETADSLAALRLAKSLKAYTVAVVNVIGSSIAREADSVLYTWAGPEIAVASTKAYSVQTSLLCLIAIQMGILRNTIDIRFARKIVSELVSDIPEIIKSIINKSEIIHETAKRISKSDDIFFIGRGADYYLSEEGSLKLKEISYIHSEAYPAGELKHGTISLIENNVPVIAIATSEYLISKTISNLRETKSRGALTILICNEKFNFDDIDIVIKLPAVSEDLAFLPTVTILQLLAYYTALERACDIDKPRNLAKSVTVE